MTLRAIIIIATAMTTLVTGATISKKDSYGGSTYSAPAPPQAAPSYDSAVASYGAQAPSYGSSGSSDYGSHSAQDPGAYGNSAPAASSSSGSDSYGNLYYYYYPVTNHSQSGAYGNGGSYGAANSYGNSYNQQPAYYPQVGAGGGVGGGGGGGGGVIAPVGGQGIGGGGGGGGFFIASPGGGGGGGSLGGGFPDPLAPLLSFIGAIDVNSLILPALLIGGVALLLPALLNCDLQLGTCIIPLPFADNGKRSARDAEEFEYQLSIPQAIDHAARIYDAVHESDQCLQRVVCEMGGMLRNMRGKDIFFTVLEHFATPSIKKQLYVLKEGALTSPQAYAANCDKFKCGKLDNKVD